MDNKWIWFNQNNKIHQWVQWNQEKKIYKPHNNDIFILLKILLSYLNLFKIKLISTIKYRFYIFPLKLGMSIIKYFIKSNLISTKKTDYIFNYYFFVFVFILLKLFLFLLCVSFSTFSILVLMILICSILH